MDDIFPEWGEIRTREFGGKREVEAATFVVEYAEGCRLFDPKIA